jgi:hypothetical protein
MKLAEKCPKTHSVNYVLESGSTAGVETSPEGAAGFSGAYSILSPGLGPQQLEKG